MGGQRHAPAALPPGKTRYPLYRRLVWTCVENLAPSEFDQRDRPARSESLYRLSYPGPTFDNYLLQFGTRPQPERNVTIKTWQYSAY